MDPQFMEALQRVREKCGFPFHITSGYRAPRHSEERYKKNGPGYHTKGIAVDIHLSSDLAYYLIKAAFEEGFTGIGVSQEADQARFIHLDMRPLSDKPRVYSY